MTRRSALALALSLLAAGAIFLFLHPGLLRRADIVTTRSFGADPNQGWQAFGGSWTKVGNAIENATEERGAKLLSGDAWANYMVEADVQLLGATGEAGLLIRSSGEEEGVDAYHGYFAGVRDKDNAFLLGRADFGWNQYAAPSMLHPTEVGKWYHLRLVAVDCDIAASVTDDAGSTLSTYAVDASCLQEGRIGLKSYSSGARWRNIRANPANHWTLLEIAGNASPVLVSKRPATTALGFTDAALDRYMGPIRQEAERNRFDRNVKPISLLKGFDREQSSLITLRGVVTLVAPAMYVQDASGSIEVMPIKAAQPVRVGDEVEASGKLMFEGLTPVLEGAQVRRMWPNVPVLPISASVFDVAAGTHPGEFVEVEGEFLDREADLDGFEQLTFTHDGQRFRVIAPQHSMNPDLQPGTRLRLRGVVTYQNFFTSNVAAFALLLPTPTSLQVVAMPPFWSPGHIALLCSLCVLLAIGASTLFAELRRWRAQAVVDERERLALDIHDTLAQSFAGIGFQLQAIQSDTSQSHSVRHNVDTALLMVRSSHQEAKRSIAALHPVYHDEQTLVQELCNLVERVADGGSLQVSGRVTGEVATLSPRQRDALFRIGQEAISNSLRHANPTLIQIYLNFEPGLVTLSISDNGCGFVQDSSTMGFGLTSMGRRAKEVGAALRVEPVEPTGTVVTVLICREQAAAWIRFSEHASRKQRA